MQKFQGTGVDVFYSYAHRDEPLREELEKHLALLRRQGYIHEWHDRLIRAGTDWAQAIDKNLNAASLILLLISPDFISSDYCYEIEMQRALERHRSGEARVVPIILRSSDWQSSPFAELQALPKNGKPVTKWEDRDEAFLNIVEGLRAIINEMIAGQAPQAAISSSEVYWSLPYNRNSFFTNRQKTLELLHSALQSSMTLAPRALSGMSGIGKTQTAVEYAYRHRKDYRYCFWLSSDTHETLLTDIVALANRLNLPEKKAQDQQVIVSAVRRWLQEHEQWLLIFDNADNLAIIRNFLPQTARGYVLLTTRAQALGGLARRVEVERMPLEEGSLFLLRRAGIISEHMLLAEASLPAQEAAKAICDLVGGLPLALDQAGAYIEEVSCSVEEYLSLYNTEHAELLKMRGGVVNDHPESIATTLALSLQKVELANPSAAHLLRFLSFLQPDAIPEEILKLGASELGPELQSAVSGTLQYNNMLKELLKFSLVQRDPTTQTLTLHRLTQVVVKDTLDEPEQRSWAQRAVLAISRVFPNPRFYTSWDLCQRCLPQADTCIELIKRWRLASTEAIQLLNRFGYYVKRRGRYEEAEHFYQEALELAKQIPGQEHPVFAETLFRIGELLYIKGNYTQAEQLYQQALKFREQSLGPNHPDVALNLHNLALLYAELGRKPAEREALYLRALEIWEQTLGPRHPDVAEGLNNLASLYRRQGRFDEAEALLHRALSIRKEAFGPENPDTVLSMEALAEVYLAQGKDDQAEPLLRDGLAMCERVLGKEHPYVARFLSNLRQLALHKHNYHEAEQYIQQTIAIDAQALGLDHPYMIEHHTDLADIYALEQRYPEAEQLYQRTLQDAEKTFGPSHPTIAKILTHLADVYFSIGKYLEAEALYQRAIAMQEEMRGPDHLDVAELLEKLARLYRDTQRDTQAAIYERRAGEIRSRTS